MSHQFVRAAAYWLWPCAVAVSSASCGADSDNPWTEPAPSGATPPGNLPAGDAPNGQNPGSAPSGSPGSQAPSGTTPPGVSPPGTPGSPSVTGEPTTATPSACSELTEVATGVSRLRRLTRQEYQNALRDVLGTSEALGELIEPDESVGPFPSNAITPATDLIIEQYQTAAEKAVAALNVEALLGCTGAESTCIDVLLGGFGTKLLRRPLDQTELDEYRALFTLATTEDGSASALSTVLVTMLQSPNFLYHVEVGQAGTPRVEPSALEPYELAARLAFFLWKSTPDDALLAAAADGSLTASDVLQAHTDRLLADPRATDAIALFHERLLGVQDVAGVSKDRELFPAFSSEVAEALRQETRSFADYVVRSGDGTLQTLLTSNVAFLSDPLFAFYGASKPADWQLGDATLLNEVERSGLLTRGAFLAMHAHPNQTSPVHRGIAVRENLLCQILPSPPATVNNVAPEPTPTTTTRQRLAQHQADPSCANCHVLIDQVGLGFEHYDATGVYRDVDGPLPVDAVGEVISGGTEASGTFDGAVELSQKLASSSAVADCVTSQWFRFALGRMESEDDACTLERLRTNFSAGGKNVRTLLSQLVQSYAFTHVRTLGTADELEESNQ